MFEHLFRYPTHRAKVLLDMPRPGTSAVDSEFKDKSFLGKKACSFKCHFCNKSFTQSGDLKNHERIHTGEHPFECRFCNRGFTLSGNLKKHERIHTGERPFECQFCNKNFTLSGDLKNHERIHTGERPFECRFCNRGFTTSGNLKNHERIHTGERHWQYVHRELLVLMLAHSPLSSKKENWHWHFLAATVRQILLGRTSRKAIVNQTHVSQFKAVAKGADLSETSLPIPASTCKEVRMFLKL